MPKLVDYAARFDCIREAAYTITHRDGVAALSLPAVADELAMSTRTLHRLMASPGDLPQLGFQWVERRERTRWRTTGPWFSGETSGVRAANALLGLLPFTDERCQDARVRRLLLAGFPDQAWARRATDVTRELFPRLCRESLPSDLGEDRRDYESARLVALVSGVIEGACTGTIRPEETAGIIGRHLVETFPAWLGARVAGAA
jgi:hypothetical protein